MDALNTPIYVVRGESGSTHVTIAAFTTYEAAADFCNHMDERWTEYGWRHFIDIVNLTEI